MSLEFLDQKRPLHSSAATGTSEMPANANLGLWFAKFGPLWKNDGRDCKYDKRILANGFGNSRNGIPVGVAHELTESCARIRTLTKAVGGICEIYQTRKPFTSGLGIAHPSEIGFLWHHTLGVPYVPGSGIKGMLRAYVEEWLAPQPAREDILDALGAKDDRSHTQGGLITFLDALPCGPPHVFADIMNPHRRSFHATNPAWPVDWQQPFPLNFLAVARAQEFQFAIIPSMRCLRMPTNANDSPAMTNRVSSLLDKCADWLQGALSKTGAGAKTLKGYGRFKHLRTEVARDQTRMLHAPCQKLRGNERCEGSQTAPPE